MSILSCFVLMEMQHISKSVHFQRINWAMENLHHTVPGGGKEFFNDSRGLPNTLT